MSATKASITQKIDGLLSEMANAPSMNNRKKVNKPEKVRAFDYRNQLIVASQFVLSRIGTAPLGIVLGSGLGGFGEILQDVQELPYSEIPFLPQPTVKGHSGKIMMGYLKSKDGKTKKRIMCFSGRLHCYEVLLYYIIFMCDDILSLKNDMVACNKRDIQCIK